MDSPKKPYKNIGKKIQDFEWIYVNIGPEIAKIAIESSYSKEEAEGVYRGLEVYVQFGMDIYLRPRDGEE